MNINLVVEDFIQEYALMKVLQNTSQAYEPGLIFGKKGNDFIRQNLRKFNQASRTTPYLIVTDLDATDCAPTLINEWIDFPENPNFIFRIAVREAETWLLGDRNNFASFLGVPLVRIPQNPETISNPKEFIIALARKSSKRKIREDLIPQGTASRGRNYNSCLGEYITEYWDINLAKQNCDSLQRMIDRLNAFRKI